MNSGEGVKKFATKLCMFVMADAITNLILNGAQLQSPEEIEEMPEGQMQVSTMIGEFIPVLFYRWNGKRMCAHINLEDEGKVYFIVQRDTGIEEMRAFRSAIEAASKVTDAVKHKEQIRAYMCSMHAKRADQIETVVHQLEDIVSTIENRLSNVSASGPRPTLH
jgi:hypothetical protein